MQLMAKDWDREKENGKILVAVNKKIIILHLQITTVWNLVPVIWNFRFGVLAQLARVLDWQSRGHRFDSDILHTKAKSARVSRWRREGHRFDSDILHGSIYYFIFRMHYCESYCNGAFCFAFNWPFLYLL